MEFMSWAYDAAHRIQAPFWPERTLPRSEPQSRGSRDSAGIRWISIRMHRASGHLLQAALMVGGFNLAVSRCQDGLAKVQKALWYLS